MTAEGEYASAFGDQQRQALARGPVRLFGYAFSVSLTFFGVFCTLIGILIMRSRFLPGILGALIVVAGVTYWINSFRLFLALPIPYVPWVTLVAELSLALWLLLVGVDEAKWRAGGGDRPRTDTGLTVPVGRVTQRKASQGWGRPCTAIAVHRVSAATDALGAGPGSLVGRRCCECCVAT